MKLSQPMGRNQLEFWEVGSSWKKPVVCKIKESFATNNTPNICACQRAQRKALDQQGYQPPRQALPRGTCFILPLAEDREGGRAIMGVRAEQLIHIRHFYTCHFTVYIYSNTDAALSQGLVLLQTEGIWRSQEVVCLVIQMQNLPFDSASHLAPSDLTCFHPVNGHTNDTKSRRLRDMWHILEVPSKFAKNQNVHYCC